MRRKDEDQDDWKRRDPPVLAWRCRWIEKLETGGLGTGRYASGTDLVEARTKKEARERWQRTQDQDGQNYRRVCLSVEKA